jgi:hypothetical protein
VNRIDSRLLAAGLSVSVPLLAQVMADHWPYGRQPGQVCPGCGHVYTPAAPECPTAATARPLLWSRRYEVEPSPLASFPRAGLDLAHPPSCGEAPRRSARAAGRRRNTAPQPDALFELTEAP